MNLKEGDIISIRHYSGVSPFKSIVMGISENMLSIKLTKEFAILNFLEGDPVVLGFEEGGVINILGCNIIGISAKDNTVRLIIDKMETEAQRRSYERFPVSIYADIKTKDDRKKNLGVIKDISYYGMLIYSKADLRIGNEIYIDIYMEKTMIFLKAEVLRKNEGSFHLEYGVRIIYEDSQTLNYMKEYLKRLKESQEESLRKL